MNGEARDLRDLAQKIEQLVREHQAHSMAWEHTRAFCDYLTCRARVMELESQLNTSRVEGFGDAPDR